MRKRKAPVQNDNDDVCPMDIDFDASIPTPAPKKKRKTAIPKILKMIVWDKTFGRHVGTAFQLMDDLLDYTANAAQMGKNAGDDLREGKPTLPLIYLLENGTNEERLLVRAAIEQNQDLPDDVFAQILAAVQNSGALDYTQAAAKREADLALSYLKDFPANPASQALEALCAYSLTRQT